MTNQYLDDRTFDCVRPGEGMSSLNTRFAKPIEAAELLRCSMKRTEDAVDEVRDQFQELRRDFRQIRWMMAILCFLVWVLFFAICYIQERMVTP